MKSPLISGNRTVEDILREHLKEQCDAAAKPAPRARGNPPSPAVSPAPSPRVPSTATSLADYIKLENISCVDADSNEFERYGELYIKKEVEKDAAGQLLKVTPYAAIHHCEQFGFLPSAALMANIHVAIYRAAVEHQPDGTYRTKNAELEQMLQKLKNRGDNIGGHWVNTLVDWRALKIIHYPQDADFLSHGDTAGINGSHPQKVFSFDKNSFADMKLADALKIPNYKRYLQNYSGLPDPAILLEVAHYYQETARSWVSTSQEVRAAWLGCYQVNFYLYANDNLNDTNAARGVRLGMP